MIHLVGGASRSGKSTLAITVLRECGVPFFSIDCIREGLKRGGGGLLAAAIEEDDLRASEQMTGFLEAMVDNVAFAFDDYLLEGVNLQPALMAALMREDRFRTSLRCCVLGYPETTVDAMQEATAGGRAQVNDWLRTKPTDYRRAFFEGQIAASRRHREDCETYGVPFVDTSHDRDAAIGRAIAALGLEVPGASGA